MQHSRLLRLLRSSGQKSFSVQQGMVCRVRDKGMLNQDSRAMSFPRHHQKYTFKMRFSQVLINIPDVLCSQGPYRRHQVVRGEGQMKSMVENAIDWMNEDLTLCCLRQRAHFIEMASNRQSVDRAVLFCFMDNRVNQTFGRPCAVLWLLW